MAERSQPTHELVAIIDRGGDKDPEWIPVAALWPTKNDRHTLTGVVRSLPLAWFGAPETGTGRIIVRARQQRRNDR